MHHYGKQEVIDLIDSMEDDFDEELKYDYNYNYRQSMDINLQDKIVRSGPLPSVPLKFKKQRSYEAVRMGFQTRYFFIIKNFNI